jgi:hypothetical protein
MTTTAMPAAPTAPTAQTALARLTRAELDRFAGIRSHRVALGVAAAATAAFGYAMAAAGSDPLGPMAAAPVALPMEYFAYVTMVLGVLLVTGDLAHGGYRTAFALVPRPGLLTAAKLSAATAAAAVAGLVVGAVVVAAAWWGNDGTLPSMVSHDGLLTAAASVATVVQLTLVGVATGLLLRNTGLAVSLLLLWSLVAETVLVEVLPSSVGAYLPFKTVGGSREVVGVLSQGQGLAVLTGYTAVLLAAAVWSQLHRDLPVD